MDLTSAPQCSTTRESHVATTPRAVYQPVRVSRATNTSSIMRCIPSTCVCCGECLKCHPKMEGGLNCRPETERTCPKSKSKSQKSTKRKLSQCHESNLPVLAKKKARYHPYLSQSGRIPNTNPTTRPPCPTQRPYPFEHLAYPQHTAVPSSPQDACADILHPDKLNSHCVNTSQASLNIPHMLQDSAHPSNSSPNSATQVLDNYPTPGVHLWVLAPQPTLQHALTKQRRLRLTHLPITPEFHPSSHRVNTSTGETETHEDPECAGEDLNRLRSERSDGNGIWCPVCGGLLGVACSGHHARVEVDGGG